MNAFRSSSPILLPKVSTNLPDPRSVPKDHPLPEPPLIAHRDRGYLSAKMQQYRQDLVSSARNSAKFWKTFRKLADPVRVTTPDSITAFTLAVISEGRMNPPNPLPESFDLSQHRLNTLRADRLGPTTTDTTPEQFFSRSVDYNEVAKAKASIKENNPSSAPGESRITFQDFQQVDNDVIAQLINECLDLQDAPSIWLTTVLIGELKRGRPPDEPNSYRILSLLCRFLKFATLIFSYRIQEWTNSRSLIPPMQNGFRSEHRTNNNLNVFVLQTVIDKAESMRKPLFVASIDLSNAFPSTDRPTLWLKLHKLGMRGKIFDWLRIIFTRMRYIVRHENITSPQFSSTIGILQGETLSPALCNLYLSDFVLPEDEDDVILGSVHITYLAQADDMLLISTSARGLQAKLDAFELWCRVNFMVVNAIKSWICLFNRRFLREPMSIFTFADIPLALSLELLYMGITMRTDKDYLFSLHYTKKASKARAVAHAVLHVESMTGDLPPKEGKVLYMGRVDPHLIHACDVILDTHPTLLTHLVDVQKSFIRRLLGVNARSMVAPLYTETGLIPLSFRRVLLALGFLKYALTRSNSSYVTAAVREALSLANVNAKSWITRLERVVFSLPGPVVAFPNLSTCSLDDIDRLAVDVNRSMETYLNQQLASLTKAYLLRNRLDTEQPNSPPVHKTLLLRHYLSVKNALHRRSLTRLILSSHPLAVERLSWKDRYRHDVPRDRRLCRFCRAAVETPEHALLTCQGDPAITLVRGIFLRKFYKEAGNAIPRPDQCIDHVLLLQQMISCQQTISLLAKFTHEILEIFQTTPEYIPREYRIHYDRVRLPV